MAVLGEEKGKHREHVFTYNGRPLGQVNTRSWRNALKRAGIENFRWHDLRHVWATWHVMAGTTLAELQELGAWKSALMVKRYAHFAPEQLRAAAARLATFSLRSEMATPQEQRKVLNNWLPDQGSNLGPAD
ncbi:MAG: tyrosine-type recombinase/integrase [Casimicrobiaceae bacterium]